MTHAIKPLVYPIFSFSLVQQSRRCIASRIKHLNVVVLKDEDGKMPTFKIQIGNSILKTPRKAPLRIEDESLALAIANEWKSEMNKKKINLANMHLTSLAYTATDNPFDETTEDIANAMLEYLKFDTVRFRDTDNEQLLHRQSRHWDPLIGWFEHNYNCHLPIEYGDITNTSSIPKATSDTLLRHLCSHKRWPLVGANFMIRNLKSFVLATCLMDRFLNVQQAVELARLETRFQVEKWSKVEWEHDLDEQCTSARVAAGALFYHLSL
uniref:ATP synthase mitochondrial F1 complex assembly factor 2 n=1 Tax=Aceria tosichella TaxID=561515 RepID=A0A6G1SF11_9ACAR